MTALLLLTMIVLQDPHKTMNDRGAVVMGFDQDKTAHHFYLYADGGAIDVAVKDETDVKNRDAIRSHLPHLAMMFQSGNFDAPMLVHDAKTVPGATVLAARKDAVTYKFSETSRGGRVGIVTADPEALRAVHAFLTFQIREHHTGDSLEVTKRK